MIYRKNDFSVSLRGERERRERERRERERERDRQTDRQRERERQREDESYGTGILCGMCECCCWISVLCTLHTGQRQKGTFSKFVVESSFFAFFFSIFFYPHEKNKTKQRMRVAVLQDIEKRKHIQRQREHERRNEDMSNPKS